MRSLRTRLELAMCVGDAKDAQDDAVRATASGRYFFFSHVEMLKDTYHWHRMEEDIKDYVRACDTCQRDKPSRHRRYGQLEPLEVPYRP